MAAELGTIASVIAVTNAAYASCKNLHDLIQGMRDAPREFETLNTDLNEVNRVLNSFQTELDRQTDGIDDTERSTPLRASLMQVEPCMKELGNSCDEFKRKLDKVSAHSTQDRVSMRDRFKLQFQDKKIAAFRYQMASYKDTVNIALSLASLTTVSNNTRGVQQLEETVETTGVALASQIKGMEISIQTLMESSLSTGGGDNEAILSALERQKLMLEECLKFCVSASAGAAVVSGNHIHFAKVQGEAKQLVGNIGDVGQDAPAVVIDNLIAQDRAKQMGGTIEGSVALKFMGI